MNTLDAVNILVKNEYKKVIDSRASFKNPYQPHKLELLATETLSIVDRCLGLFAEVSQLGELKTKFELEGRFLDIEVDVALAESKLATERKNKEEIINKILTELTPQQIGIQRAVGLTGVPNGHTLIEWHNMNVAHAYAIRNGDDGQLKNKNPTTYGGWLSTGQAVIAGVEHVVRQNSSAALIAELANRAKIYENKNIKLTEVKAEREKSASEFAALDFNGRISAIIKNLLMPYLFDVHQRCLAIAEGVMLVHNYSSVGEVPDPSERSIYELAGWLRNVLTMLAQGAQRDQGASIVLSVKSLTGVTDFVPGVYRFQLNKEHFLPYENVRLRGVSASALVNDLNVVFSAKVKPPALAVGCPSSHEYGGVPVDQSEITFCKIGKILPIAISGNTELAGTITLFNVRPVSQPTQDLDTQWIIELTQVAGESGSITDLLLELRVIGVPLRGRP